LLWSNYMKNTIGDASEGLCERRDGVLITNTYQESRVLPQGHITRRLPTLALAVSS